MFFPFNNYNQGTCEKGRDVVEQILNSLFQHYPTPHSVKHIHICELQPYSTGSTTVSAPFTRAFRDSETLDLIPIVAG